MKELKKIALNGCDTFMLAMDHSMRRAGSQGNICHLLITFPFDSDIADHRARLLAHPTFLAVTRLRLSRSLLGVPRWISRGTPTTSLITLPDCRSESDLHGLILSHELDIERKSPFGVICLPHHERGPALLFYWHHALCDAHGAETLITSLGHDTEIDLSPSQAPQSSSYQLLRRAHLAKKMIFEKARGPIARLTSKEQNDHAPELYKLVFSAEETRRIDHTTQRLTGGMFPTAVYLAATARAVASVTSMSKSEDEAFFIPVPHDIRRSSKQRSPLSNQISMAFFRLSAPLRMSLIETTNTVIHQLHDTIAERYQHGVLDFLHLLRRLPAPLLWRVIESPARGHPASFYLSDIGASLSRLDSFSGDPVVRATHYPPVLSPPGFTTVWSRYRNSLEVTICFDKKLVSADSVAKICDYLRQELTGDSHES